MKTINRPGIFTHTTLATVILLAYGSPAHAVEFETEGGWKGSVNTTLSAGASWRAESPDSKLFSAAEGNRIGVPGGTGATNTDSGNLNWDKGDRFSTPLKAVMELSMRKDEMGLFARAKTWHDQALADTSVRAGNGDTNWAMGQPLSDKSQPALNKFNGLELLDAYVYNSFDVGGMPLQVRAGKQVVNWGESLFLQGLNQLNPVDIAALRKPGTEIKEALLPVWSLYGNLGLGGGASLEAFYQMKWQQSIIDSCGGYWSPVEFGLSTSPGSGCSAMATTLPGASNFTQYNSGAGNSYVPLGQGKDGSDSGQFGFAFRLPVASIDSEIGAYAMQINSRTPIISAKRGARPATGNLAALPNIPGVTASTGFWEYPDKINIYGLSLSTNISGWSVAAELSHTPNQPVQINGNDMLSGLLANAGPLKGQMDMAAGSVFHGYDTIRKTQLQANTIKILPSMMGASQGLLVAEVGMQWNDVSSDPSSGRRYGRGFIFGNGASANYGGGCAGNPQVDGCKAEGYVTPFAWGYRVKASLDYPGVFGAFTMTPSVFWGHDVSGFSSDTQFIENRKALTLGLKFDYKKKYTVDFGYTTFGNEAAYDMFRDRDFYSASFSMTF